MTEQVEIDPVFQRHNDIAFRVAERLLKELLAKGLNPYAVSNAFISHGVTLLGALDGNMSAADFVEHAAEGLRELAEAEQVSAGQKH